MKKVIKSLLKNIQDSKEEFENKNLLTDKSWHFLTDYVQKTTYIFKNDGDLIISTNGEIKKTYWTYIKNSNSLIFDLDDTSKLFNINLLKDNFLIINQDGIANELVFINQSYYQRLYKKFNEKVYDILVSEISESYTPIDVMTSKDRNELKQTHITDNNAILKTCIVCQSKIKESLNVCPKCGIVFKQY